MATTPTPQVTDFSRDVLGRYVCNGLDEALRSTDPTIFRSDGRPQIEAREFDFIVIGGGTFGAVVAEHLSFRDRSREHRILVLEGGPMLLPEHVQNLPVLGLGVPTPTSIADLRTSGQFGPDKPRQEVWGLPWHSLHPFPGLAYCVGGRSLYWGGWSPELLPEEMPIPAWPQAVFDELGATTLPGGSPGYFRQASDQIGTSETNDFISGELHRAIRKQLFDGVKAGLVVGAVPLATLPPHPVVRYATPPLTDQEIVALLELPAGMPTPSVADARNELKLEAPLAVQGRSGHAGFFPFNKFSAVPLLIKAAREAYAESGGDDVRKRVMIVPRCHVTRLRTVLDGGERRVTVIGTSQGPVPVPAHGKVVIALGTIESIRLALDSFRDLPPAAYNRIGTNLMAHLRSNLDIRFPREALVALSPAVKALQASALFVKGRHAFAATGDHGRFHLQITASGLGALGGNSEAELFKKVPDIDTYDKHRNANDTHVVMTIRAIGEMQPNNPGSHVALDPEQDEFTVQRAKVTIADPRDPAVRAVNLQSARDFELWNAMDQASKDVAKLFGVASPPEPVRDGLGTTHHETGGLFMGDAGSSSVTLPDGRIRHVKNVYVVGPALFPTIGSPNPMLTGVALARRLGDQLATPTAWMGDPGFTVLFNGFDVGNWRMTTIRNQPQDRSNPGSMRVLNGALETVPGNDMGIYWHTIPTPQNFLLRLQWLRWDHCGNSGVYVRFPNPELGNYNNSAFVADDFGFEVQIDECGDIPVHRTGAIYRKDNRTDFEVLTQAAARGPGEWNDYEIRVVNQLYTISLNGQQVCAFDNATAYPTRGQDAQTYLGLQVYPDPRALLAFRRIQIQTLP